MYVGLTKIFKNFLLIFWVLAGSHQSLGQIEDFKSKQLKSIRVKNAYDKQWPDIKKEIEKVKIDTDTFEVFIRAFKLNKELEIWLKDRNAQRFVLLKTYTICESSGKPGPKRREGDRQVPEGFYEIESFNEGSLYHLAMKVSYPNKSDRIKGRRPLGGYIMIHGKCKTIGCLPMTDEIIEKIYVLCMESAALGKKIRVDIYPCRLENDKLEELIKLHGVKFKKLWAQLKLGYDYFELTKLPAPFTIDGYGNYNIAE